MPPKKAAPVAMRRMPTQVDSTRRRGQRGRDPDIQRRRGGAIRRSPTASPSHQVVQIAAYFDHGAKPATERVVTPTVALTIVLKPAASAMNLRMSRGRESAS